MVSLGEAVRLRADLDLHAELIEHAEYLIYKSNENKPLHDTGERFIDVQDEIDAYRNELNAQGGFQYRPVTIEYSHEIGWYAHLSPPPPMATQGEEHENR